MAEVNELFAGWEDYPPVSIMVKALVEGLGGGTKKKAPAMAEMPPEAMRAMQDAAIGAIAQRAGHRLPIVQGKDQGLPKAAPVFDLEEMRKKNAEVFKKRSESVGH